MLYGSQATFVLYLIQISMYFTHSILLGDKWLRRLVYGKWAFSKVPDACGVYGA